MRVDYAASDPVFVDFETVSFCDLRQEGGRAYAAHPSTRILCCALMGHGGNTLWIPDWVPLQFPAEVHGFRVTREMSRVPESMTLCGHNAFEFDAHVWRRFIGTDNPWRDTLPLCRAAALPAGLDAACAALFDLRKNPKGKVLEILSRAVLRGGRVEYPIGTVGAWLMLLEYCADDVRLLERLHGAVLRYAEPDVLAANQAVNDRGIPVDEAFCATVALLQDELSIKRRNEICEVTEEDLKAGDVGSAARVKKWIESKGVRLPSKDGRPSLDRRDLHRLLEDPESFGDDDEGAQLVAAVLKLRSDVARNTIAKAMRMLRSVDADGRIRGQHAYHAAHTGRWGGRSVQPHNFPRGVDGVSPSLARVGVTLDEIDAEAARLECSPADVLSTLLRPCIAGRMAVGDYGQVEARGVCWLFGERGALDFFRDTTRDYYTHYVAPQIYGKGAVIDSKKRWLAKQTGLGAGYGLSGRKMRAYLEHDGVDFAASGTSPEAIIRGYREAHPAVVAGWKELEFAAFRALEGRDTSAGRVHFSTDGTSLVMRLPSGRCTVYREAGIEMQVPMWAAMYGASVEPRPTIAYTHPRGWRGTLYGGRLCFGAETLVLTRRGWIPIVEVTGDDAVWDGEEWVATGGAVYNGEREVVEWLGVSVTGDHLIHDGKRWRPVMALDESATRSCLEWGAYSISGSCSKFEVTENVERCCASASDAVANSSCGNSRCYRIARTRAVRAVERESSRSSLTLSAKLSDTNTHPGSSSSTMNSYAGAILTQTNRRGTITAAEGSGYATNGLLIRSPSHDTTSHWMDGTSQVSCSIGSTTIEDMNQATCGSSHTRRALSIDAVLPSVSSMEHGTHSRSSGWFFAQNIPNRRCGCGSNRPMEMRRRPSQTTAVYDLFDCGPRHRYMVMTAHGPVMAHNCENAVQGLCRDILADALVRSEAARMDPFLHVHDEEAAPVPATDLAELMSIPPVWADGFPLLVEAFEATRYWKKPPKGTEVVRFMCGRRV